mgnify:FL=1
MLITLYKIGERPFRLLGTNGFHVKAKNERFTAASSRCGQNLKYENFTSSFGRLRQKNAGIFPHLTNEIVDLWRCCSGCARHFLNSPLKLDSVIQRISHHPLDKYYQNTMSCPIGSAIHPNRWLAKSDAPTSFLGLFRWVEDAARVLGTGLVMIAKQIVCN